MVLVTIVTFALCCGYQFYAYAQPVDYHITYDFPLLPIPGAFIFEWIRRKSSSMEWLRRPVSYISRISLAIYFLHMIILSVMKSMLRDAGWTEAWRMLVLEIGPVGLSIAIIAVLSKIKFLRKYLFLIK